jgi:hypothetical protein
VIFGRRRFAPLVESQLDVFVQDHGDLVEAARQRLADYDRADRAEAEERYGDYVDAVDEGADLLAEIRDGYARTVDDPDGYVRTFNRAVARRLPELAFRIENR